MSADDIAAWLTAIWDEDEARLADPTFCGPVWPTMDQLLARIAADRKILAWYLAAVAEDEAETGTEEGWITRACREALYEVVKLLALPHADRPGYHEEWRP